VLPPDRPATPPPPPRTLLELLEYRAARQALADARTPESIRARRAAMSAAAGRTMLAAPPTRWP